RIRSEEFRAKLMGAADAAALIQHGWTIGFSGFTGAGYPKELPGALATRIGPAHGRGEGFTITVLTGASTAPELAGVLARTGGIGFRAPYQSDPDMRAAINAGISDYCDIHLSHMGHPVARGFYGPLDCAI